MTKPRIFAKCGISGLWIWNVSTEPGPPSNWFEWQSAVRYVARVYARGAETVNA